LNSLLASPAIMMGIGLFFGVILAVAYRLLKVDEDPRIDETEEMLPGTNCGACGVPGCLLKKNANQKASIKQRQREE